MSTPAQPITTWQGTLAHGNAKFRQCEEYDTVSSGRKARRALAAIARRQRKRQHAKGTRP